METKFGADGGKASVSEFSSCKDNKDPQSSAVSTTTNSLTEVGIVTKNSNSDGVGITRRKRAADASENSSEGTTASLSSMGRALSLENSLLLQNHSKSQSSGRVEINQVDDADSNTKLTHKVTKRLMAESSSSNSSDATNIYSPGKESQKEVSVEVEPSCSVHERSNEAVVRNSVDSMPLKKGKNSGGAANQITSFDVHDSQDECLKKHSSPEKAEEQLRENCPIVGNKPEEASMLPNSMAATESSRNVFDFDLNADLEVNETDIRLPHFADQSGAAHCPVNGPGPVVVTAKLGVPNGLPPRPLQFEGELGWKRTSSTSAFQYILSGNCSNGKVKISNHDTDNSDRGWGFDLNVALSMDRSPVECDSAALSSEFCPIKSPVEARSSKKQRLSLDLNCGDEKGNENNLKLRNRAFDLNENLFNEETCNHVHQPGQSSQPLTHRESTDTSTVLSREGARPSSLGQAGPPYWVEFGSIPSFTHVPVHPFLVASGPGFYPSSNHQLNEAVVPLQSKVAFTPSTHTGFYMGEPTTSSSSSLYAQSILPHLIGQPEPTVFIPQIPSGEMLATYQAGASPPNVFDSRGSQGLNLNGGGHMSMLGQNYYWSSGIGTALLEHVNRGGSTYESSFMGLRSQFDMRERIALAQRIASAPPTSDKQREAARERLALL